MRLRVEPFQAITCRKMPEASRSAATLAGAATAMPPSLRKRCWSALYAGMARMLSPTQLRPMTTVSHAMYDFAFSRPFPAIVHPKPKVGAGNDAPGDHVVDSVRQHHRVSVPLRQQVGTNRLVEFDTMPEAVGNAKSEHNRRAGPQSHFGRCGRGPCGTPEKGNENAFARLHGLVGQEDDHRVFREPLHEHARGAAAVDDGRSGLRAEALQVALEHFVVYR